MTGSVCRALWTLDVTGGQTGAQGKVRTCGRNFRTIRAKFDWHGKVSLTLADDRVLTLEPGYVVI